MKRDGLTLGWGMAGMLVDRRTICRGGERAAARRRHCPRRLRHPGHRHRHLHDPGATCLVENRRADRQDRGRARRHRRCRPGRSQAGRWPPRRWSPLSLRPRTALSLTDDGRNYRQRLAVRERSPADLAFAKRPRIREGRRPRERRAVRGLAPPRNIRLVTGSGDPMGRSAIRSRNSRPHSFGCHFVEVTWQPEIARLRVSRVVTVSTPAEFSIRWPAGTRLKAQW